MSGTWTGPNQILDTFLAAMMARLDTSQPLSPEVSTIVADGEIVAVREYFDKAYAQRMLFADDRG